MIESEYSFMGSMKDKILLVIDDICIVICQ
jgi:hypothetical protein